MLDWTWFVDLSKVHMLEAWSQCNSSEKWWVLMKWGLLESLYAHVCVWGWGVWKPEGDNSCLPLPLFTLLLFLRQVLFLNLELTNS